MRGIVLCILGVGVLLSCSKDDNPNRAPRPISNTVVNTGYHAYDPNGSFIFDIGTPNTKRDTTINGEEIFMRTFPNPAWPSDGFSGTVIWNVFVDNVDPENGFRAILVKANYIEEFLSPEWFENGGFDQDLVDSTIVWEAVIDEISFNVEIEVPGLGDYRLYVEMDSITLYDNFAVREFLTY
jgi:hypothetical protein